MVRPTRRCEAVPRTPSKIELQPRLGERAELDRTHKTALAEEDTMATGIGFTSNDINIDETASTQSHEIDVTTDSKFDTDGVYAHLLTLNSGGAGDDANFPQVSYVEDFLALSVPAGTTVGDLVLTYPNPNTAG